MKIGILAGGLGARLAEETEVRPKPMVEIGGRPILWHIMKHYAHHGFREFVLALGYKGEQIKRYMAEYHLFHNHDLKVDLGTGKVEVTEEDPEENWVVDLVDTGTTAETGARIRRILPQLGNETFMLTYGDGVSNVDLGKLLEFHKSHGRLATLTAVHPPSRFGKLELDDSRVVRFDEKPQFAGEQGIQTGEGWINGGFFVLEPGIAEYIDADEGVKWELAPLEKLAKDGQLMAYLHYDFWQCMDTLRDKKMLEMLWETDPPWRTWETHR